MPKLRVGIIESAASRPLAWGFLKGHHADLFTSTCHSPALIGQLLAQGNLDIGLLPAVELQRIPDLLVLPDLCVAAAGASRTSLLVSRVPLERVKSVAVDHSSRNGLALLRILLHRLYALEPRIEAARADLPRMLAEHDAALLIGDAALQVDTRAYHVLDLAAEWHRQTGLPCVSGLWAVRSSVQMPDLLFYFKSSLRYGLSLLDNLARETAAELDVDVAEVEDLYGRLSYFLQPPELEGLSQFFRQADELGLIEQARPLSFWER